jgi:hypothetical protein
MNLTKKFLICAVFLAGSVAAYAMPVTGTVTNKTTGKPAEGDRVSLVDPSAGMADIDKTTTDKNGHFSLTSQGPGQFLIRVDHQGSHYFSQAPQSPSPLSISVYDVAEKVDGITIEANVLEIEADNGQLTIDQRYFVKNASSPPTALLSKNTFEFALPDGAVLKGASASRPTGLPTTTEPEKLNQKGHYTINSIPIEPNQGNKETVYDIQYQLPYSGKYTFTNKQLTLADNMILIMPKQITFKADGDATYASIPEDPRVQTYAIKGAKAGQNLGFTISGTGTMPREQQGNKAGPGMGGADASGAEGGGQSRATNAPGGGIGNPNSEDDALSKYKWWIVGFLVLILVAAAFLLLRRKPASKNIDEEEARETESTTETQTDWSTPTPMAPPSVVPSYSERPERPERITPQFQSAVVQPVVHQPILSNASLLNSLKDELFSIETDKLNGLMNDTEYAEAKFAIDVLLKRALKKG